jgi:RIO kinase 2
MSKRLAQTFKQLGRKDFKVLLSVERKMSRYEYVPAEEIFRFSKLETKVAEKVINRLHGLRLLRRKMGAYTGYALNYAGYDCLALNTLVKRGTLHALGQPIGVGKESDVYEGLDPQGERVAVKFYRFGRISFRQVRRSRKLQHGWMPWLLKSKAAAEREIWALRLTYQHGVPVPKPIDQSRHVVVIGLIVGAPLAVYSSIPEPKRVLDEVLDAMGKAYQKAGIINADLSEYNVLIKPDGHVQIIDWPQAITKDHPNADALLERDVKNLLSYFKRKFGITKSLNQAIALVRGD